MQSELGLFATHHSVCVDAGHIPTHRFRQGDHQVAGFASPLRKVMVSRTQLLDVLAKSEKQIFKRAATKKRSATGTPISVNANICFKLR